MVRKPPIYLKQWRKYRGLNQEAMAEAMHTTAATISRWERARTNWKADRLISFAEVLRCEVADLFRDPTKPGYQLWREIEEMPTEHKEQALRIVRALKSDAPFTEVS